MHDRTLARVVCLHVQKRHAFTPYSCNEGHDDVVRCSPGSLVAVLIGSVGYWLRTPLFLKRRNKLKSVVNASKLGKKGLFSGMSPLHVRSVLFAVWRAHPPWTLHSQHRPSAQQHTLDCWRAADVTNLPLPPAFSRYRPMLQQHVALPQLAVP